MSAIKIVRKPVKLSENMTPAQIKRKRITIDNKINQLYGKLGELQQVCQHPNVTKKYRGDTGNYDPSADSYWIEWKCPDCHKSWITDQSLENRLKPGQEIK